MVLGHIMAAADESDAGRQAVRAAADLAARCSARLSVVRVVALEAAPRFAGVGEGTGLIGAAADEPELDRLRRWLEAGVLGNDEADGVQLGVAYGIPGIEICRYAEGHGADLVVLGRKQHSRMMRLLLGDTADAVARRSRLPGLFVQQGAPDIRKILVALDGGDRGMSVLSQAAEFARQIGATLQTITVESSPADEPPAIATSLPLARTAALQRRTSEMLLQKGLPDAPLRIRRGDISDEVTAEVRETGADLLVVGYRRGGPPGVIEAGSIGRRLAHAAACAIMTVPL